MKGEMKKNGAAKLLTAVAVLAMVVCAFVAVASSDVSATESKEMVITISDDGGNVKFVKDGTAYTPIVVDDTRVLVNASELNGYSKVIVNMTGGTVDKAVAIVNYDGTSYAGSIDFNMSGGVLKEGIYMTYTHGWGSNTAGTWDKPINMAGSVTANITAGKISGAIQPVINYLSVGSYTINVSGSADIATLKTAGSNGTIRTETVNISGGKVGYITAQRSMVGSIAYNISGGEIDYFTIGADIEGANNTSAANMQTGFVTGNVDVTIASSAKVNNAIVGGGILDMPVKNANNNTISSVMDGKLTIDAPGKTIKLQNSFYNEAGKVAILYTYPTITYSEVSTTSGLTITDFWNGENVFGTSSKACKEVVLKDGSLFLPEDGAYYGEISNADNKIEVQISKSNGLTFSKGSVGIDGAVQTGSIIVVSGKATVKDDFTVPNGVTLEVKSGATLNIPEGVTLTNNGTITNSGTIVVNGDLSATGEKKVSGTVAVKPGVDATAFTSGATIISTTSTEDSFGMSKDLESDYTIKTSAFLENDLTVPEGITLTVEGSLDLNGKTLTVYGTLNVTKKGQVQTITGGTIVLGKTGAIVNDGIIGYNSNVTVMDQKTPASNVTMKNVVGVNFALTKEIANGTTTYTLTVSGDVSKKGSDYSFKIVNAYITDLNVKDLAAVGSTTVVKIEGIVLKDGSLTIGTKTVAKVGVTLVGAVMNIDGKLVSGTNINMYTGSIANVNGVVDGVTFSATTGSFETYDSATGARNDPETELTSPSTVELNDITGVTIEVTSKGFTEGSTAKTEQMLNVYGTPSLNKDADDGTVTVTGTVYVPTGKELALAEKITAGSSGEFIVLGTIKSVVNPITNYKGASYSVKVDNETATAKILVNYYTTFDAAYAVIADVEDKEITVKGGFEFSKEYVVDADQTITLNGTNNTISKDGKVTVNADGTLSGNFATPSGIQGILVVMDGGDCKPADGSYEVSSKDADNNMTYSGAAVAIENATAGSTIYITNPVTFTEKTTIPADVTVDVATGASVTAEKGLVVNGTIVNNGTVTVTGNLDVNGEVDNNGTVSADEITVKGTFKGAIVSDEINAAKYNNGEENIYTTVAAALEAVAKMDVPVNVDVLGKVSETSDVTLVEGMTLFIKGEVTLKSVRLVAGSILDIMTADAKLTADVIGAVGKTETTGAVSDAVVDVSKLQKGSFKLTYSEATSTTTMTMKLDANYAGAVVVEAGEVALDSEVAVLSFDESKTLKVASGATLVLNKDGLKFTDAAADKKYFVNEGKLDVKNSMTLENVTVSGQVVVAVEKILTLKNATVLGDITLSEKEGKEPASVKIDTMIYVGSNPENLGASAALSGKIDMNGGYAIVFAGSTFSTTADDVKSTKYLINGIEFATIFGTADIADINSEVLKLKNIDASQDSTGDYNFSWYAEGVSVSVDSETVGKYSEVTTTIDYKGVKIKVSAGPGIIVYIDDLKVTGTENTYEIGAHKITAYIEPSYTGTLSMTINGKTITNGQFEVTTDMLDGDNMIVVTGASPVEPVQPSSDNKDDGMGLTDILLIVLVVLIAVMAIMVALRMMRS